MKPICMVLLNQATYSQLSWEFDWEPLEAVDVTLTPVEQG